MNIICDGCVGARLYERTNRQFNNPFMWCRIKMDSYVELIKEFDNLNYDNVEFSIEPYKGRQSVKAIIDGKVTLHYSHYVLDESYKEPTKVKIDIMTKDPVAYAKMIYSKRMPRMKSAGAPTFLYATQIGSTPEVDREWLARINDVCTKYQCYAAIHASTDTTGLRIHNNIHLIRIPDDKVPRATGDMAAMIFRYLPIA